MQCGAGNSDTACSDLHLKKSTVLETYRRLPVHSPWLCEAQGTSRVCVSNLYEFRFEC